MAQTTTTAAKATRKTTTRAQKPAASKATKAAPVAYVNGTAKPTSGQRLVAHTHAALDVFGLFAGAGMAKETARKVFGDTALAYHKGKGNFEYREDGQLYLTAAGQNFFGARKAGGKVDEKIAGAFAQVMMTGEPDGDIIKTAQAVTKFKAA